MLRRRVLMKMRVEEGASVCLIADLPLRSCNGAHSLWAVGTWPGRLLIVLSEATLWIKALLLLWAVPKYLGPVGRARVRSMGGCF